MCIYWEFMVVLVGYEMLHRAIMRAIMVNEKSPSHKLGYNANAVTPRQVNLVRRMCPKALAPTTPPYFPTPGPGLIVSMTTWCRTKGYLCIYSVLSVWFACSPCAYMGSLQVRQLPPTVQRLIT